MNQLMRLALDYAEAQLNGVGRPYGPRFRSRLVEWWLAGFRNERRGMGNNFDRPLEGAWRAGRKRGEIAETVKREVDRA